MSLTRLATWKDTKKEAALLIVDGIKLEIAHDDLSTLDTAEKIEAELNSQASISNVALPKIFAHINRDGSIALATGQEPLVWPENENVYSLAIDGQPRRLEKCSDISYVHFTLHEQVNVRISVQEPISHYTLSPQSENIVSRIVDNEILISLERPAKLILHNVNALTEKLFIFADAPGIKPAEFTSIMDYGVDNTGENNEPATIQQAIDEVANTRYFPPGIYRTDSLYLRDGVTLHLAKDSRLRWDARSFVFFSGVRDAALVGHGTVEAGVQIVDSNNIILKDVILLPHADCYWSVPISRSQHVMIQNLKLIADFSLGHDGFDPSPSSHILIENTFAYTGDDFVAIKALESGPDIRDIVVRNCITYNGAAACKIGTETQNDLIADVTFENVDCISFGYRALRLALADGTTIENVAFKDIRIESFADRQLSHEPYLMDFRIYTRVWPPDRIGHIRNIRVQNLDSQVALPSCIHGMDAVHRVEGVVIDNCKIQGEPIMNAEQGNISELHADVEYRYTGG